jgi:hypothetical protein
MLTLSSILIAGLFVAAPAPQAENALDADAEARVGDTNIYEFEGDSLEGRVLTAEGTRVRNRRAPPHESLIKLRRTFLDRLYAHTTDI